MQGLVKRRSLKIGLPPGTLIHIGEEKTKTTKIVVIDYDETGVRETEITEPAECLAYKEKPAIAWINVCGLQQVEVLEQLGRCFGIHPLVMEDVLNTDQRPKVEYFDEYVYIVLKMLFVRQGTNEIAAEQISLILCGNCVISFQEGEDIFEPLRERIRSGKGRIRKMGADYLAYALLDFIVDNYFAVLEKLGERVEFLEERLVASPTRDTLHAIHSLKREMIFLRRSVWPLREVVGSLERGESPLVGESAEVFFRDVYDHTVQIIDTVETFRDMLSGMLDIYLSSTSNRLNEVMKVLTIIATVFIPLTFLVGVYGMNFKYMPELRWPWAYPALWVIMITTAVLMLFYFRKKKWL